jgi:hypothetical protein
MNSVVLNEMGEPWWESPHEVAMVNLAKLVAFADDVRNPLTTTTYT